MIEYSTAIQDFQRARRRARLQEIWARFTGASPELLAFEDVRKKLRGESQIDRGLQNIPLSAIAGSVGRYRDFTRTFLPRQDSDKGRWAQVLVAQTQQGLPPISVYQIGDIYFVEDGNHRVSIARHMGNETIEAYVTEVQTKVPLTEDIQPDELILKAEYADFLAQTHLDVLRPETDFSLTSPGNYPLLLEHIEVHRYYMGLEQKREIPYEEAVAHWHDFVYQPVMRQIQQQRIMREFPGRTEADLYVWLAKHRARIEEALGWKVSTATIVSDLADQFGAFKSTPIIDRVLQAVSGQTDRQASDHWWREHYQEQLESQLSNTILLPVSPEDSGWQALQQALVWASCEQCQVIGLYAVPDEEQKEGLVAQMVAAEFRRLAERTGTPVHFKIETGEMNELIQKLARWVDLIALPVPPTADSAGWERIRRAPGLVLAVPGQVTQLESLLLVYEQGPYVDEALFLALHYSRQWQVPLGVVSRHEDESVLQQALQEMGRTDATLVAAEELTAEAVLEAAAAQNSQLIVMGDDAPGPLLKRSHRDTVEQVLRHTPVPLLLYR
jgi:nucleotide-binding universal stress UspA family protein